MTALRAGLVGTGGGLLGGLAFGAAMLEAGVLPTVAGIVHADSTVVGALVHLVIAALLGAGFGLLTRAWARERGRRSSGA
jgi:hypothetical protein